MTTPTLENVIENKNYARALELYKTSDSIYSNQLRPLHCLRNFNINFQESKTILEKSIYSTLLEKIFSYMQTALTYNKGNHNSNGNSYTVNETFLVEESFMVKNYYFSKM